MDIYSLEFGLNQSTLSMKNQQSYEDHQTTEEKDWLPTIELPKFLQSCDSPSHDTEGKSNNINESKTKNNVIVNPSLTSFHDEWIKMLPTASTNMIPQGCNLHGVDLDDQQSLIRCLKFNLGDR